MKKLNKKQEKAITLLINAGFENAQWIDYTFGNKNMQLMNEDGCILLNKNQETGICTIITFTDAKKIEGVQLSQPNNYNSMQWSAQSLKSFLIANYGKSIEVLKENFLWA